MFDIWERHVRKPSAPERASTFGNLHAWQGQIWFISQSSAEVVPVQSWKSTAEVWTVGIVAGLLPSEEVYPHQILRNHWVQPVRISNHVPCAFWLLDRSWEKYTFIICPCQIIMVMQSLQGWGQCTTTGLMLGNPVKHVQPGRREGYQYNKTAYACFPYISVKGHD